MSRTTLHGVQISIDNWHTVHRKVSTECMGSALEISEAGGLIEINTHINPSAGCVLILKSNLSFVAELFGWIRGRVGCDLILEENAVHFAPTHPLRVSLFNLRSGRLLPIYPAAHDAAREGFVAELRKHLRSTESCAEQNRACDPETFSASIANVKVDEQRSRFSFDVEMNAEGFGNKDDELVSPKTVHYTYRHRQGRWVLTN